jgi:mono/diheme cytochrome c family protein
VRLDSAPVRRLVLLALLAVLGASCSVPGGEVTSATPETVVGPVPVSPTETVPPEYQNGDPTAGKAIFLSKGCGACHTLSDAAATGVVGPSLDEAKPGLALVVDRVVNGKGTMPSFKSQLTPQQIADLGAYVVQATSG